MKKPKMDDMLDAINHAEENGAMDFSVDDFDIKYMGPMSVDDLREYDDVDAWMEAYDEDDLRDFRGDKWYNMSRRWLRQGVPPVIVITAPSPEDGKMYSQIGDGRGRINFANVYDIPVPVYHMAYRGMLEQRWDRFVNENADPVEALKQKSETFRTIWDRMEENLEDTVHHNGESTAEHTRRVHRRMMELARDLPAAEKNLMEMLAILHDIGKPDARTETPEKVRFPGHPKSAMPHVERILDEIAYEQKELLMTLISRHMDILQGLNNGDNIEFLAKNKVYPYIERLAMMSKSDLHAIGNERADDIDALVSRVHDMRKRMEQSAREREKRAEMEKNATPEEFVNQLKSRGVPAAAMRRAISGKFDYLSWSEIEDLIDG